MKTVIIDNYDSFTYNLAHLVKELGTEVDVLRNDKFELEELEKYDKIILSPGPGIPEEAGLLLEVIRTYAGRKPILGVCLGEQAIGQAFGGKLTNLSEVFHGIQTNVKIKNKDYIFDDLPTEIPVGRYHSWVVDTDGFPEELVVTAISPEGQIMALKHREYDVHGIQFHPESVLTPDGRQIIVNFLQTQKGAGRNMIKEAVAKLVKNEDIGYDMAKTVMDEIMSGEASDILKSAYLTALSQKGETIEEITGSAEEMRKFGRKLGADVEALEIVGTGGDGSNSFNISTTASIVISAAGVPVAKHGNRAASSKSGAADCLEALGVNITIEPEQSKTLLEEIGICFLFAQKYHTAMKYVGPIRKELGIRTIFNILGPLANPAGPVYQIMGAYDESLLPSMA